MENLDEFNLICFSYRNNGYNGIQLFLFFPYESLLEVYQIGRSILTASMRSSMSRRACRYCSSLGTP